MTRLTLLFLLCGLLLAALSTPVLSGPVQEPAAQEEEGTVIEDQMKAMKGGMRQLRRGLRDAENLPAALPIILEMQQAAHISKTEVPRMAAGIEDEKERAMFVTAYRQGMIATQKMMLELEDAALEGNLEKCAELYNALKDAQDKGHDRFTDG
ncbi:MAG: cytochrome b562 [Planctomycetes bacterium]|nr:cytochrome b562 [Planctomycetota bacterium]